MREVVVVPYDPRWPSTFQRVAGEVKEALGECLVEMHHIGSTSIPGIHAKPIIDVLAVTGDLTEVDRRAARMREIGYEPMGEFGIDGRRYFRRDDAAGVRTEQVHAFASGSPHLLRHLAFRDYLRAHGEVAQEYARLKQHLAAAHRYEIEAYMDGKDAFIRETQAKALEWVRGARPIDRPRECKGGDGASD